MKKIPLVKKVVIKMAKPNKGMKAIDSMMKEAQKLGMPKRVKSAKAVVTKVTKKLSKMYG